MQQHQQHRLPPHPRSCPAARLRGLRVQPPACKRPSPIKSLSLHIMTAAVELSAEMTPSTVEAMKSCMLGPWAWRGKLLTDDVHASDWCRRRLVRRPVGCFI